MSLQPPRQEGFGSKTQRWLPAPLLLVMLFVLPLAGSPPTTNPNETSRLELSIAMAEWATINLENPARIYGLSEDVAWRDGRMLADKAPGLSVAAVPLVWFARVVLPRIPGTDLPEYWPLRHFSTAILVALAGCLVSFFIAAGIPELRPEVRVSLALVTALSTPIWAYGTVFFGHVPAAVLITVAWVLLLKPLGETVGGTARTAFLGGFSAGLAIATEYPTALLVAIILVTLIARQTPRQQFVPAVTGLVIALLPTLIYHQIAFGAPWATGYSFKADPGFQTIHTTGLVGVSSPTLESLWGVLFSSSRGLFFYSPVLLLALFGLWLMHHRHGWRDVAPLMIALLGYIGFAAGFVDWQAGWCAAARHLVPAVGLMMIPTMVAMVAMAQRLWTLLALTAIVTLSAVRGFLTVVITPFFPPEFSDPLAQIVLPSLRDGIVAPNLISTLVAVPSSIVWTAAALLTAALLVWGLGTLRRGSTAWVAVGVALALAGQAAWWGLIRPPPDPDREEMRAQLLAGLGHGGAAAQIEEKLQSKTP